MHELDAHSDVEGHLESRRPSELLLPISYVLIEHDGNILGDEGIRRERDTNEGDDVTITAQSRLHKDLVTKLFVRLEGRWEEEEKAEGRGQTDDKNSGKGK